MGYCMEFQEKCILCQNRWYSSKEIEYPFICYHCSRGRNKKLLEKIKEQYVRNLELSQK